MISAVDEIDSVVRAIELGAADYLPKPFNPWCCAPASPPRSRRSGSRTSSASTRARLERELEIGRQIQRDFLPDALPQPPGWEIAAAFHPARQVAGDFYDAFALEDGRVALVVGDVCDKGVGRRALHGPLPQPPALARRAARRGHAGRARRAQHRRPDQRLHRPDARPLEHVRDDLLRHPRPGDRASSPGSTAATSRRCTCAGRDGTIERLLPTGPGRRRAARDGVLGAHASRSRRATCSSRSPTARPRPARPRARSTGSNGCLRLLAAPPATAAALLAAIVAAVRAHEAGTEPGDDLTLLAVGRAAP